MSKWSITVSVDMVVEMLDDENDDADEREHHARFFYEDNHCIGNELERLGECIRERGDQGKCDVCAVARVKLNGPIDGMDLYPPKRTP